MGAGTEYILEGRPDPRGPWGARVKVAATIAALVALPAVAFALPRTHPKPTPTPSDTAQPPTPLRTLAPGSIGFRLLGMGPFVVYEVGGSAVYAVDLGDPSAGPIRLGSPVGQDLFFAVRSPQSWGRGVPILRRDDTQPVDRAGNDLPPRTVSTFWLLSAGRGFDDPPLVMNGDLSGYLPSPDGRQLIAFWTGDNDRAVATLVPADGTLPTIVGSFPTNGSPDEVGPLEPMVWLPNGSWLALPICECGGTDAPTHWYSLSQSGGLVRADWLGTPADEVPGVSADGRYLSFFEQPFAACSPDCTTGPVSIVIADTVTHTLRTIARFPSTPPEDPLRQSTALSPDATLVATSVNGSPKALVMAAATGKIVQTITVAGHNLRPFAFIDDSTLVLGDDATIFVARDVGGAMTVTPIAQAASFVGWTR